jgi:hypothetical protein
MNSLRDLGILSFIFRFVISAKDGLERIYLREDVQGSY